MPKFLPMVEKQNGRYRSLLFNIYVLNLQVSLKGGPIDVAQETFSFSSIWGKYWGKSSRVRKYHEQVWRTIFTVSLFMLEAGLMDFYFSGTSKIVFNLPITVICLTFWEKKSACQPGWYLSNFTCPSWKLPAIGGRAGANVQPWTLNTGSYPYQCSIHCNQQTCGLGLRKRR